MRLVDTSQIARQGVAIVQARLLDCGFQSEAVESPTTLTIRDPTTRDCRNLRREEDMRSRQRQERSLLNKSGDLMRELTPVQLELFKAALSVLVLAAGWLVGQRVIVSWDLRKKRLELDIAAAERFQRLYGDLKQITRLWRAIMKPEAAAPDLPDHFQWALLERTTNAESEYEAILIKLSTERVLSETHIKTLGLFRQATQQIRHSIARGDITASSDFGAEYLLFNELAVDVTLIVASTRQTDVIDGNVARRNLESIALVRSQDWSAAVREYSETKLTNIRNGSGALRNRSMTALGRGEATK